jgi:hypothetical protein
LAALLKLRGETLDAEQGLRDQIDVWSRDENGDRFEFLLEIARARVSRCVELLEAMDRWLARIGRDFTVLALSDGQPSKERHRAVLIAQIVQMVEGALSENPRRPTENVALALGVARHRRGADLDEADAEQDVRDVMAIWRSEVRARSSQGKHGRRSCAVRIVARALNLSARRVETFISEAGARLADERDEVTPEKVQAALAIIRGEMPPKPPDPER